MANQPHPSRQAVTWRLQRELVEQVKQLAHLRQETVLAFVSRALEHELRSSAQQTSETPSPTPQESP